MATQVADLWLPSNTSAAKKNCGSCTLFSPAKKIFLVKVINVNVGDGDK